MNTDDARERFSAAYDGMLPEAEREEFEAALAGDEELRAEYEELKAVLDEASALDDEALLESGGAGLRDLLDGAHELAADEEGDDEGIDLVAGVQERIRQRSGGRFYRDRFSQQSSAKSLLPLLMGAVMLLIVAVAYLMLHHVELEETEGGDRALPAETTDTP